MRPVIPKVRVGDILLGTKNLRNWLQTGSLLSFVNQLASPHIGKPKKGSLYIPTKKDRFVVAVNSWETFAVWGLDRDLIIMFCNPTVTAPRPRPLPGRPFAQPSHPQIDVMNPGLFAQWFIRTRGKNPDLMNSWPDYAYYLWGSLQMNAISSPDQPLTYMVPPGTDIAFRNGDIHGGHHDSVMPKADARERVRQAIRFGLIRRKVRRRAPAGGRTYGPILSDIPQWKEQIRMVTTNPRVMKNLKDKLVYEVPAAVFDMIANQ